MSDTLERIKKVTAELLNIDAAGIKDDARFVADLGAQSVQAVELIAGFEEEFEIELEEEDALAADTVAAAAKLIDSEL